MRSRKYLLRGGRYLLCAVALLLAVAAEAGEVTRREALQKAKDFMAERGMNMDESSRRRAESEATAAAYYVFNAVGDGGFVIISGDDRTVAVLGYADEGNVDEADMPEGLKALLQSYEDQMAVADAKAVKVDRRAASARRAIAPFITTKWNQGNPYNLLCPVLKNAEDQDELTVTGCVATAVAQVMNYHHWPVKATTTVPAYTTRTKSISMDALPATTFDWVNMLPSYSGAESDAAKTAVSTLMRYAGQAVCMDYRLAENGSSSYNVSIPEALKAYFGYDNGMELALRRYYSYADWVNLIYGELAEARPVILGGQSVGGGHSFVCDGYQGDDYFHINWGWSGRSDGYFRLMVLAPSSQGIGGSTTLDGYNWSQDAVIGIKRGDGSTPVFRLSLEGLQTNGSEPVTVATVSGGNFLFPLTTTVCNYRYATTNYDVRVVLKNAGGEVVAESVLYTNLACDFNSNNTISAPTINIPTSVADGTYSLTAQCRQTGTETWVDCYGSEALEIEVVVADGGMTLTNGFIREQKPTLNSIGVPAGTLYSSQEIEVTANLTGPAVDFHHNLQFLVNGNVVMGKQVDIPAGRTVDVPFSFTPTAAGDYSLTIHAAGTQIGSAQVVTVAASDATDHIDLTMTATVNNLTGDGKVYGTTMVVPVTVTNPSAENSYAGRMYYRLWEWTQDALVPTSWHGEAVKTVYRTITVGKNTTEVMAPFMISGLQRDKRYSVEIFQMKDGAINSTPSYTLNNSGSLYQVTDGYLIVDENGTPTVRPAETTIAAGAARYVNLQGLSAETLAAVTSAANSNPNCLWLLNDGAAVPTALSDKNVITGNTATTISLSDGHDFWSPVDFTAATISYTRTFTLAANGTSGWNTIMLPFDVSTVKVGEKTVDWFHSGSDTGKNFWVRTFTGDDETKAYFDYADRMEANTPYLIAVPDDRWGAAWQMTGREVTFYGTDAEVAASQKVSSLSGSRFNFSGSTLQATREEVYALNDAGGSFVKTASATIAPFRAWISGSRAGSLTQSLAIVGGVPTLIETPDVRPAADTDGHLYDLQGRRVPTEHPLPGIYVRNGKKIVIK